MTSNIRVATPLTERRQYRLHCPHCRALARVRSSAAITAGLRELYLVCTDDECGHVFAAQAETRVTLTHTITPSSKPDPAVELRIVAPRFRPAADVRPPRPANDTLPATLAPPGGPEVPPANDDDALGEATG